MAADIAIKQLEQLGYAAVHYPNKVVGFLYIIPHGRFRGQQVEIALQVPNFPDIPPPGPNIKPFLLPINPKHGAHPFFGVHVRNIPDASFQYWSRPFLGWDQTEKTMEIYIAFLRTLFDFE